MKKDVLPSKAKKKKISSKSKKKYDALIAALTDDSAKRGKKGSTAKAASQNVAETEKPVKDAPVKEAYVKETWCEFRKNGLLTFVNMFLHIFGWAIVMVLDKEENIITVYPSRTKYRGFSEATVSKAYIKLSEFMDKNHKELLDEARS